METDHSNQIERESQTIIPQTQSSQIEFNQSNSHPHENEENEIKSSEKDEEECKQIIQQLRRTEPQMMTKKIKNKYKNLIIPRMKYNTNKKLLIKYNNKERKQFEKNIIRDGYLDNYYDNTTNATSFNHKINQKLIQYIGENTAKKQK